METLSDQLLSNIFKNLPLDDFINTQFVCTKWRDVYNTAGLWIGRSFKLTDDMTLEYIEQKIKSAKYLPAIWSDVETSINVNVLDVVLTNLTDLRKINCKFNPPLNYERVQSIVEFFPHIESLTLDTDDPDFISTLAYLKTVESITEIFFIGSSPSITDRNTVCTIMGDGFKNLEKVDFASFYRHDEYIEGAWYYFFWKKQNQLKHLKVDMNANDYILSYILNCPHLTKYNILMRLNPHNTLKSFDPIIEKLSSSSELFMLPTLVHVSVIEEETDTKVQELLFHNQALGPRTDKTKEIKINWTMTNNKFKESEIISSVCLKLNHLSSLAIWYDDLPEDVHDLNFLFNLKQLQDFRIAGLRSNLPDVAFTNIAHCKSLECLFFRKCVKFSVGNNIEIKSRIGVLLSMLSELTCLKYLWIINCSFEALDNSFKRKISSACTNKIRLTVEEN